MDTSDRNALGRSLAFGSLLLLGAGLIIPGRLLIDLPSGLDMSRTEPGVDRQCHPHKRLHGTGHFRFRADPLFPGENLTVAFRRLQQ